MNRFVKINNDISDFIPISNEILILKKGIDYNAHQLKYIDYKESKEFKLTEQGEFKLQELYNDYDKVWIRKWEGGSLYFDKETLEIKETDKLISKFISNNMALCVYRDEYRKKHFIIFDTNSNGTLWEHRLSSTLYMIFEPDLFFLPFTSGKRFSMICTNLKNGTDKWEYNLDKELIEQGIDIQKIIEVNSQYVVLSLSNDSILLLDAKSGHYKSIVHGDFPNLYSSTFAKDTIKNLVGNKYYEYNLSADKTQYADLKDYYASKAFVDSYNCDNLIFIANNKQTDFINHLIGSFDTESKKINWIETLELHEEDSIINVKQIDNKIYALSAKGHLYNNND